MHHLRPLTEGGGHGGRTCSACAARTTLGWNGCCGARVELCGSVIERDPVPPERRSRCAEMNDAQLAAIAGLIGVGVSGAIQAGLAFWADRKHRRAAVRLVERVLMTIAVYLRILASRRDSELFLGSPPKPEVIAEHKQRLARELSRGSWLAVTRAYSAYDIAGLTASLGRRVLDEGVLDIADLAASFSKDLRHTADQMEAACRGLAPLPSRLPLWIAQRSERRTWERLADERDGSRSDDRPGS